MPPVIITYSFLFLLGALSSAMPAPEGVLLPTGSVPVLPEITPGPGLPSLASLNLTSEKLYAMRSGTQAIFFHSFYPCKRH